MPGGSAGDDRRVLWLRGGDAFRYGDVGAWVAWARTNPRAWVGLEGPAASLAGDDADALVERALAAGPDGYAVVLPTVDPERTAPLTGRSWEPARALARLARLAARGASVAVVVPVNEDTVGGLCDVVTACEGLGVGVDVVLRRSPLLRSKTKRLPVLGGAGEWGELAELSRQLAMLPEVLRGGVRLCMDPLSGYAPCMLDPEARRADLISASAHREGRDQTVFGPACDACEWQRRCNWQPPRGASLPLGRVLPLTREETLGLQAGSATAGATHRPHAPGVRRDRRALSLPDVLCVAPWAALSMTEWNLSPVPCALSWVQTSLATGDAADALGISQEEMRSFERRAARKLDGVFHCLDNATLSLSDLWNSPLLRIMRRQMLGGGPTRHCRSMCRTVMGVEDRAADLFARPDDELTEAVAANRRRLADEMREGKVVLESRPLEMVVGVASHCNITCGFCVGPAGVTGELTDRRRDEIIGWLPTLMSFGVAGPGEPLMSRNYLAILQHIADVGYPTLSVELTTNGTLLTPEFLRRHAGVRWAHVRISLNAGSAGTHARMTGKNLFDRVMNNLDALCALRETRHPHFPVTLSCVLSEMVMGDLHAFAEIATRYRTDVVVEPMYGDMNGLSPWTRPEKLGRLADELGAVARDFALRNPPLSRAFRAVEEFARQRLALGDFAQLAHH